MSNIHVLHNQLWLILEHLVCLCKQLTVFQAFRHKIKLSNSDLNIF
jgi:hypothetical protein